MFLRLASKSSAVQPASKSAFAATSGKAADAVKLQATKAPQPVRPPPPPPPVKNVRDIDATLDGPPATTLGALFGAAKAAAKAPPAPQALALPPAPVTIPPAARGKKQCRFNEVVEKHVFVAETWESTLPPELPPLPPLPVAPALPPPPSGPTLLEAMVALIPNVGKDREMFAFIVDSTVTKMTPAVQTEVLAALLIASKEPRFSKQQALDIVDDFCGRFVGPRISYSRS